MYMLYDHVSKKHNFDPRPLFIDPILRLNPIYPRAVLVNACSTFQTISFDMLHDHVLKSVNSDPPFTSESALTGQTKSDQK